MEGFSIPDSVNNKVYSASFSNRIPLGLMFTKEIIQCRLKSDGLYYALMCNINEKTMDLLSITENEGMGGILANSSNTNYSTVDLDNMGNRWEGPCYNDKPFGFGNQYNDKGELVYSGFMYGYQKIGFGVLFFPDLSSIEYIGTFCNGRCGYGILYDRRGSLLYDGEWIEDHCLNDFSFSGDALTNEHFIHSQLKEITIGNDSFIDSSISNFILINYACTKLTIGSNCFPYVTQARFLGMDYLEELRIGENSFVTEQYPNPDSGFPPVFTLQDCPKLKLLRIGDYSFQDFCCFIISGVV